MSALPSIKVGLAQIYPIWLNKEKTLDKIMSYVTQAAEESCDLVVFGEALLPGYPFWLSFTKGSEFESQMQKEIHAHYIHHAVSIKDGDIDAICTLARAKNIAIYLGSIERAQNRGGHSLYCSLIYIDKGGIIQSVHRKLQPTYEERLSWAPGDGHGLQVHKLNGFTLGGLNCWENWMPLSRAALYAQGENIHVAVWPGCVRNTHDLTPIIAKESRSYSISVSAMMHKSQIPQDVPHYEHLMANAPDIMADGGSCIAAPNGDWIIEPIADKEGLFCAELDLQKVYEERQNFDPSGHYSRPDVTKLIVNRERQAIVKFKD